jgi:hypothetical protein
MPSLLHEALVDLLRTKLDLARDLGRRAISRLPPEGPVRVSESKLPEIFPTEYSADLVLLFGPETTPRFGLVIEVQLHVDPGKSYSWPLYVATLRARHQCPCCVLVLAPNPTVAAWAARPIDLGQAASTFTPLVLGPDGVPRVVDADVTRQRPEQGVVSAIFHNDDEEVATAAFEGLFDLLSVDPERALRYNDILQDAIAGAVLERVEMKMTEQGYQYVSEFARKHTAKGRAEEAARAVLAVFEAREMAVPDEVRERIEACKDPDVLEQWHKRAIKAESPEDIFAE